jgi:succinate dehydrogenase/fumarate reductase cytochrome b subunit
VTKVDEWTKAETGVGAAIAAGSHALNGIWALFVHPAKTKKRKTQYKVVLAV